MLKAISVLIIAPLILFAQEAEEKNVWELFHYFVGSWEGHETGKAGIGKGDRTYEFIMGGKYLYFKITSVFEPQEQNPEGEVHIDWTFFSHDEMRDKFGIREFNIEGYVNQYILEGLSDDKKTLVFVAENMENVPPGFHARLTYDIQNENEFDEIFELAPSGKELSVFLKNHWTRIK